MHKKILWSMMLVSVLVLYLLFDPALYSFFPQCPFYRLTGYYCPGCGSQRAIHKIVTGHIGDAAGLNFLAVLYLPLIVTYYASSVIKPGNDVHRFIIKIINKKWFIYGTLFIVLIFGIIRNTNTLPGIYLAP